MGRQKDGVRRVLKAFFCVTCHKSTREKRFPGMESLAKVTNRPKKGRRTKRRPPTRGNHHFLKKTAKYARFNALCLAGAELRKRTQDLRTHAKMRARVYLACACSSVILLCRHRFPTSLFHLSNAAVL